MTMKVEQFSNCYELTDFVNRNKILQSNIVSIIFNCKSTFYTLFYFD